MFDKEKRVVIRKDAQSGQGRFLTSGTVFEHRQEKYYLYFIKCSNYVQNVIVSLEKTHIAVEACNGDTREKITP